MQHLLYLELDFGYILFGDMAITFFYAICRLANGVYDAVQVEVARNLVKRRVVFSFKLFFNAVLSPACFIMAVEAE